MKFEVNWFLQGVEQLAKKKLVTPNGKKICENAKQTSTSQNESDSRKS